MIIYKVYNLYTRENKMPANNEDYTKNIANNNGLKYYQQSPTLLNTGQPRERWYSMQSKTQTDID